jgi:hypothetical protein
MERKTNPSIWRIGCKRHFGLHSKKFTLGKESIAVLVLEMLRLLNRQSIHPTTGYADGNIAAGLLLMLVKFRENKKIIITIKTMAG